MTRFSPPPMNDDEPEQMDLILPAGMLVEINARAASRGLEPADLIDDALTQAMQKGPAYRQEMMEIVSAIDEALALDIPAPWPESFEDRVVAGVLLSTLIKHSSETVLLETSGPKMDAIEEICRAESISYDELTQRAITAKLNGESSEEDDRDEADWWKQKPKK